MPKNYRDIFLSFALLLCSFFSHGQLVPEEATIFDIDTAYANDYEIVVCNDYACFPIVSSDVIKDRLSCIQNEVILDYNGYTKGFFDYFLIRKRSYIAEMMNRKDLYFPFIEQQLAKDSLPDELKYMTVIESGLNTRAQSPVGAIGMWQFMKTTGQMYGLESNWYFDERMDFEKASIAACKFMGDLYKQFGDWRLAIAGYNCGAGNVRKAIRRSGYSKSFWNIYPHLPRETRGYVPQFMAVMYAMEYPGSHAFYPDSAQYFPDYKTVEINSYFNLETFAELSNYCIDDLIKMNPEIKRNVILDSLNYQLRLPIDLADTFLANKSFFLDSCNVKGDEQLNYKPRNYRGSTEGKMRTYYTVNSGDYIAKVANLYDVSIKDIRSWNNMRSNMIYVGQKLAIWKDPSYFKNSTVNKEKEIKKNMAENKLYDIPANKMYTVQPGDTLWDISRKFKNVSIEQLKKWNNLTTESLKVGQTLKLGI